MENSRADHVSAMDATSALAESAAARETFVGRFSLPRWYSLIGGLGNAALAYGVALGNSTWRFGSVAFVLGLAAQATALTVALRLFRSRNGASVRGVNGLWGPRSTRVVVVLFMTVLIPCIIGSTWLMVAGRPILSALVALGAVPATAVADRCWIARFRVSA